MIRVESNTDLVTCFTEFEEDILFDDDDPDFEPHHVNRHALIFKSDRRVLFGETRITLSSSAVTSRMSLASVHPAELHSSHSSLATLSHSLDDLASPSDSCWNHQQLLDSSSAVITIEELRDQLHCCFSCGVSWAERHVSLDCSECGGYAMERPCTTCADGACGAVFRRDVSMSHASGKAKWMGECSKQSGLPQKKESDTRTTDTTVAQELSSRLEKLNANS